MQECRDDLGFRPGVQGNVIQLPGGVKDESTEREAHWINIEDTCEHSFAVVFEECEEVLPTQREIAHQPNLAGIARVV